MQLLAFQCVCFQITCVADDTNPFEAEQMVSPYHYLCMPPSFAFTHTQLPVRQRFKRHLSSHCRPLGQVRRGSKGNSPSAWGSIVSCVLSLYCTPSTKYWLWTHHFFSLSSHRPLLFSVCSASHFSLAFLPSWLFLFSTASLLFHFICTLHLFPPSPVWFLLRLGFLSPLVSRGERQWVAAHSSDQSRAAGLPSHCW